MVSKTTDNFCRYRVKPIAGDTMTLTEVYHGTDEKCPECEIEGRKDPSELTYVSGLVEPGVYALICPKHGTIWAE